jgi:hypothetical protein
MHGDVQAVPMHDRQLGKLSTILLSHPVILSRTGKVPSIVTYSESEHLVTVPRCIAVPSLLPFLSYAWKWQRQGGGNNCCAGPI